MRDLQKDPDGAEFRNVKECPTGFYVTGEVNGKKGVKIVLSESTERSAT